jgi:mRNA-degrading endonuclease RelE of RelBE toxin-antitoxin system
VPRAKFRVVYSAAAQADLERLDPKDAIQIVTDATTYLSSSPLPIGKTRLKRLSGFTPVLYRLRSGDFRAYYRICGGEVVILRITDRKDAEKLLKRLR